MSYYSFVLDFVRAWIRFDSAAGGTGTRDRDAGVFKGVVPLREPSVTVSVVTASRIPHIIAHPHYRRIPTILHDSGRRPMTGMWAS